MAKFTELGALVPDSTDVFAFGDVSASLSKKITFADLQTAVLDSLDALNDLVASQGAVLYQGSVDWEALAAGNGGQVLMTNGSGADPTWDSAISGITRKRKALGSIVLGGKSIG